MRSPSSLLLAAVLALPACGSEPLSFDTGGGGATVTTTAQGGAGGTGGTSGGATTGGGGATGSTSSTATETPTPMNNGFPDSWPDGVSCAGVPPITVWAYDDDTYILRQSLCTHFEGPFLYLLFGEDKVLLQDTGTGNVDVAGAVSGIISDWLAKKGKASIQLEVTHSHSHGDHTGGDSQFSGLPNTTVVGTSVNQVQGFFGIDQWPTQVVAHDLGGRVLDIVPIPGHQSAHVAIYDKSRGLLLTGDTLYPGRLYINNWAQYVASIQRIADFVASPDHPVTWVLGTHIEMSTTPGDDYAMGAKQHPSEHPLQLTKDTLLELHQAVQDMGNSPQYQVHDDFIVFPL
ncbi:MAG: MBL fold metallo-hydrolase [Polyangiaceae bacterium]